MRRLFGSASREFLLTFLILILLAASLPPAAAEVSVRQWTFRGGDAEGRAAYFAQSHRFWGTGQYPTDPAFLGKMVTMSTGMTKFLLWCRGKVEARTGEWRSSIGMGRPSKANWFQNSFYIVRIDGERCIDYRTELGEVRGGEKGTCVVTWHHPKAVITSTFTILDDDDKLLVQTNVAPQASFKRYRVELVCYPSSLAGGYDRGLKTRDREASTAHRILKRPKRDDNKGYVNATLTRDESWVLFYDRYYDVARNRGEGPCAVAYSTAEAIQANVSVTNYGCTLALEYPASQQTSHLVLWDFNGLPNAEAQDYLRYLVIESSVD